MAQWTRQQLLAEKRRRSDKIDGIMRSLHDKQRAFVEDTARRKSALTSRRAGKTYGIASSLILSAIRFPGCIAPFITLSRPVAKRIMWPVLKKMNQVHDLRGDLNQSELTFTLPSGGQVWCTGVDDEKSIDKLRGSAYPCVGVDEAASIGNKLQDLVDDVLGPCLLDYDGQLMLSGTPSAICAGYFFDATNGMPGWSKHKWTVIDNPFLKNAAGYLEQLKAEREWDETHPTYMREWRGLWVKSKESVVYNYLPGNIIDKLPSGSYVNILGGDRGYDDACALVVASWSLEGDGVLYLHDEWKKNELDVTEFGEKIAEYRSKNKFSRVVIDRGGLGKMIVQELNNRHGAGAHPAEKSDKPGAIELFNEDMRRGKVKIVRCPKLTEEWDALQWSDYERKIEDDRFDNHLSDSALYAYREARHYMAKPEKPKDERPASIIQEEQYKTKLAKTISQGSQRMIPRNV
jgi:hypothetical protein